MRDSTIIQNFNKINKKIDDLLAGVSPSISRIPEVVITLNSIVKLLEEKNIVTKDELSAAIKSELDNSLDNTSNTPK